MLPVKFQLYTKAWGAAPTRAALQIRLAQRKGSRSACGSGTPWRARWVLRGQGGVTWVREEAGRRREETEQAWPRREENVSRVLSDKNGDAFGRAAGWC